MNRDEVDRALGRLRDEKERIGTALLDLDGHQGHRLVQGASLSGETGREQARLRTQMDTLWELFDLYGRTLGEAEELRARHPRPGQTQLAELTRLLQGPSVELPVGEVPLERRTLLSATTGERLTLRDVVERMTPLYEEAARSVAALDATWSALLSRLESVEADARAVRALVEALGEARETYRALRERLDQATDAVRTDPLGFDPSRLDVLAGEITTLRDTLTEAERLRRGFDQRISGIREKVESVRQAEERADRARAEVLAKIASPGLPPETHAARMLRDRLTALRAAAWSDLATRVRELEQAANTALDEAHRSLGLITGLLDRREELRGRLEAYRAKAGRLGHAEDAELTRMYEEGRALLWSAPCDLRKATVALSRYQQAISSKGQAR
jgi:predicted  nucleic acid-binding Zn-ribbon protein